jgi:hypothetical protein
MERERALCGAKEIGNDVYKGIQIAFAEHRGRSGATGCGSRFETMDTERDPATASRLARRNDRHDADIIGIIGPVFSTFHLRGCGSRRTYGANPPWSPPPPTRMALRQRASTCSRPIPISRTADGRWPGLRSDHLGIPATLAVLAPVGCPRPSAWERPSWSEAHLRSERRILATEWYPRGNSADLSQQLTNIRRAVHAWRPC